jgi:hypothetical protein
MLGSCPLCTKQSVLQNSHRWLGKCCCQLHQKIQASLGEWSRIQIHLVLTSQSLPLQNNLSHVLQLMWNQQVKCHFIHFFKVLVSAPVGTLCIKIYCLTLPLLNFYVACRKFIFWKRLKLLLKLSAIYEWIGELQIWEGKIGILKLANWKIIESRYGSIACIGDLWSWTKVFELRFSLRCTVASSMVLSNPRLRYLLFPLQNWLQQLGFQYCTQKKGYFVEGHKKPAIVVYRYTFISHCFEYERRTHRWVQLSASQANDLQEKHWV